MSTPRIEENALFIADAHYPHHGEAFLTLLQAVDNGKIQTPQLFLMGDIFDLLFGHNDYIQRFSHEAISLLQQLSQKLEIVYLEGNHDFCLTTLFPHISVYPREQQPVHFKLKNENLYLSHGDKYETKFGFNCYSKIIRSSLTLRLLRPLEKPIIDHRMGKLKRKKICGDFKAYAQRFDAIIRHYPKNSTVVEGHFHQARFYKNYISLPSLACQQQIGVVNNGKIRFQKLSALMV